MGEYALYCGLGGRVAVLTYTKQEGKKHLLLEKDLAAYGTSGKSRTRRRRIAACMALRPRPFRPVRYSRLERFHSRSRKKT